MADLLCIGTTGMLAGCVRSLIADGHRIVCLARTPSRLEALADSIPDAAKSRLSTSPCDYRDLTHLAKVLDALRFEPTAAICWVHSPAEPVLELIRSGFPSLDLLRVVGSSTSIPEISGDTLSRVVRLGFVIDDDRSRWLSHEEISAGVYKAFVSGAKDSIVGTIEPWDQRP